MTAARRTADTAVPLHPVLATRWSPHGFDRDHDITDEQVTALLEAARWAPSANNSQPWRFLVARRDEAAFGTLTALLADGNRAWAAHAGALVLVAAQTVDEAGRERRWAHYDTGQAVAALTVQAQAEGLAVHQMGGFDAAAAHATFGMDPSVTPLVVAAIGRHDPEAPLPEHLTARERAPRTRDPIDLLLITHPERRPAAPISDAGLTEP
jgi:nitroreductase